MTLHCSSPPPRLSMSILSRLAFRGWWATALFLSSALAPLSFGHDDDDGGGDDYLYCRLHRCYRSLLSPSGMLVRLLQSIVDLWWAPSVPIPRKHKITQNENGFLIVFCFACLCTHINRTNTIKTMQTTLQFFLKNKSF